MPELKMAKIMFCKRDTVPEKKTENRTGGTEKNTYKLFRMCLHRHDSASQILSHSDIFQAETL